MRILSFLILISLLIMSQKQKQPHGSDFKISCNACHSTKGWHFDKEIYSFDHNKTRMKLNGQHAKINCRQCHSTLVFSDVKKSCSECHTDVHQETAGLDCARCHNTFSWLVENINEVHQASRFPLLGAHRSSDCFDCHKSETMVRFDIQGIECIDCHRADYLSTTAPSHAGAGFSEECSQCHPVNAIQWTGAGFNHSFFPLVQGHSIPKCAECHTSGYVISAECFSCHSNDYKNTANPSHTALAFPTSCEQCHTLQPGWNPAEFKQHDAVSFPIYSGRHSGEWNSCTQCHTSPSDYSQFSCLTCHEHNKTDMDNKHRGENGYVYVSTACLQCHPRGEGD
jgi:hypothetical protein